MRLAEFGTVYRYEQSGELGGMTRVRGFTQDDAHLFCTEEQVADEFRGCIEMTQYVLQDARPDRLPRAARLSRSGERQVRRQRRKLDRAEAALEAVCTDLRHPNFTIERGEAAFYGPKADFVVSDCIGREWQLGTVQFDYNLPSRAVRPGIHRRRQPPASAGDDPSRAARFAGAVRGRADRAFRRGVSAVAGAGAGPRAGRQPEVRGIRPQVEAQLRQAGFRVTGDYRAEKIGSKIRDAQLELVPYMFVIGERERRPARWPSATGSRATSARCRWRRWCGGWRRRCAERRIRQAEKAGA